MRPNDQDVAERGRGGADSGGVGGVGLLRMAAITMPASEEYVSFARMATAHIAGALGLSVGRVEDLRLAVDEACGQFLQGSPRFIGASVPLELCFDYRPQALRITVRGPISSDWPDRESLGWLVLDALVTDVRWEIGSQDGGVGAVAFVERLSADDTSRDALWFAAS